MNRIREKIANEDGVTILWGLFALLIAVSVSAVLVVAANTMMHRVSNDRQTEQTRLTLESAAQLIGTEMAQTTVTRTGSSPDYSYSANGPFGTELKAALKSVDSLKSQFDSKSNGITETEITVSGADMDAVTATFVMYPQEVEGDESSSSGHSFNSYDVVFTLTCGSSKLYVWSKSSYNSATRTFSWQSYQVDSSMG